MPDLIDSHALVAAPGDARYPMAAGIAPVSEAEQAGEWTGARLLDEMAGAGIARAVLVQRNRYYGYDNRYVTDLAASAPDRLRAVCAVDGRSAEAPREAERLLARPAVAGIRFMEPGKDAPLDWLSGPHARDAWRVAAETGKVMQVHLFPWARGAAIPQLLDMAAQCAPHCLVLDGLTNIDLAAGPPDFGIDDLFAALAEIPQAVTRVTAMALARCEAAGGDTAAALAAVVDLFSADRVLWGSDIRPPGLTYPAIADLAVLAVAPLDAAERAAILGGNAARIFFAAPARAA